MATASEEDRTVKLWDVKSRRVLKSFAGGARQLAFTPDGHALLAGGVQIRRIDLASGTEQVLVNEGRWWVAFSPDAKLAAVSLGGTQDTEVKLWDLTTGTLRMTLKGGTGNMFGLAFSPDGQRLAAGGGRSDREANRVAEGEIMVWQVGELPVQTLRGNADGVSRLAWSPDGGTLVAGYGSPVGGGGVVWAWDVKSSRPRLTLEGQGSRLWAVAFSPDGRTVASGGAGQVVDVWDVRAGQPRKRELTKPSGWIAVSPDDRTLAAGDWDGEVTVWDAKTGEKRRAFPTEKGGFREFRFADDGTLLTVGGDKQVRSWDVATGQMRASVELHELEVTFDFRAAFSPDSRSLAATTGVGPIQLFDAATGRQTAAFRHGLDVAALAWSPDGRLLAVGGKPWEQSGVQLWDVPPGPKPRQRLDAEEMKGPAAEVRSLAFSGDGNTLATGDDFGRIRLWEVATGRELRELRGHANVVYDMVFTKDGKSLASAMGNSDGYPGEVRLWNVETGQGRAVLGDQTHAVFRVLFSGDEQALYSTALDRLIWVWDLSRP